MPWTGPPAPDANEREIISGFGDHEQFRKDQGLPPHLGTDIAMDMRTPLTPFRKGRVVFTGVTGFAPRAGNVVIIDHGNWATWYGHLDEITCAVGQDVRQGADVIGYSGDSGSTPDQPLIPHLHFAIEIDGHPDLNAFDFFRGDYGTPVDPVGFDPDEGSVPVPVPTPEPEPRPEEPDYAEHRPTADRTMFNNADGYASMVSPNPEGGEDLTANIPVFNGELLAKRAGRLDVANRYSNLNIFDVRRLFPDDDDWRVTNLGEEYKRSISVHHDAVAFGPGELDFDDPSPYAEFARMRAIWKYHRDKGWNGIGYHFLIGPSGRVFMAGAPDTHRAHTKGRDPSGRFFNRTAIGICFMGNFADSLDAEGRRVQSGNDRPSVEAMEAFTELVAVLPMGLHRDLELHPHKWYPGNDTACPGTWTSEASWGSANRPERVTVPAIPDLDQALARTNEIYANVQLFQQGMDAGFTDLLTDLARMRDWIHELRNIRDDRSPT